MVLKWFREIKADVTTYVGERGDGKLYVFISEFDRNRVLATCFRPAAETHLFENIKDAMEWINENESSFFGKGMKVGINDNAEQLTQEEILNGQREPSATVH